MSSSPTDLAPPFTISHQCSAFPWNIKVVKATLCLSVHSMTSSICSVCQSYSSACIGPASPLNAGGYSFWNCSRDLCGLVIAASCTNHSGILSGILWSTLSCSTTTSELVGDERSQPYCVAGHCLLDQYHEVEDSSPSIPKRTTNLLITTFIT